MKICMMTNTYLPHVGGVARSVHSFSEAFRARRHQVLIVAPTFSDEEKLPERVKRHVVRLPAIQHFNGSDFSMRLPLTWLMNPILNAFKPDIVHSHHPYLIGDSALRYAAGKNAPVIFTHHTLHEEYTHYVPFDSPAMKQFVIELCTQYANLCDAVIAPSESIAQLICKRGVTTPVAVIPTGIEVNAFASGHGAKFRRAYDLPEHAFIVGHVGRLAAEKNLEFLSRAVCRFLQSTSDARFLVVGDGPLAPALREIFQEANLSDRLSMTGKLTGRDLHDAYAAMDVFAFSSQTETQGMVIIEAMAAGLPVVALAATGVNEVVRDGENGFLLPSDSDETDFTLQLRCISRNADLRHSFSGQARRMASKFSLDETAEKTLLLYEKILRSKARERSALGEDPLKSVLKRLEVEWTLVSEKAGAVLKAFTAERGVEALHD